MDVGNNSGKRLFKLSKNPSNPSFLSSETFFYFTGTIIPLFQLGLPARALQWQAGRSP
jgi:hypothetical protein